ncbi:MAG: tetratricopeptide repeat-containing sensor histidine kinase, partial [Ferruginibacter sp.]|nr:tetratricopeptide repeat-containing sensor histidine kinase [Cytophagales bacterium]
MHTCAKRVLRMLLVVTSGCHAYAQLPDLTQYPSEIEQMQAVLEYARKCAKSDKYEEALGALRTGVGLAQQASNDTMLANYQYFTGVIYRSRNHTDSAVYYQKSAERLARKAQNVRLIARTLLEQFTLFNDTGQMTEVYRVTGLLKALVPRLEPVSWERASVEERLALITFRQEDYQDALSHYLAAIRICEQRKDTVNEGLLRDNIGGVYHKLKNFPKSLKYRLQAATLLEKAGRKSLTGQIYVGIADTYFALEQPQPAIRYYQKAVAIAKESGAIKWLTHAYNGLGEVYQQQRNYPKAELYFGEALRINRQNQLRSNVLSSLLNFGKLYYAQERYPLAQSYLREVVLLADTLHSKEPLAEAYAYSAKTAAAVGNFREAFRYQALVTAQHDSVHTQSATEAIAEMEVKYEAEKRQQQIALLDEQTKTQTLQLQIERRNRYYLLAGLGMVAVIAGLLYRSYRLKQRANRELGQKNQQVLAINEELQTLNERLDEANQSKTKLFSIISHDLRAPVSSLFQFLQLQRTNPNLLNPEQQQYYRNQIEQSADTLLEAMEDLLLWSKSQMTSFAPAWEMVHLKSFLSEAIALHQPATSHKDIQLRLDCPADLRLTTDPNLLGVIIRNLLSNAIKFTPAGSVIHLSTSRQERTVVLSIKDTGGGIDLAQLERLLDWSNIKSSASGFGLKLAKEFVDRLGGQLQVHSTPG